MKNLSHLLIDLECKINILYGLTERESVAQKTLHKYMKESNEIIQQIQKQYFNGNFENSLQISSLFDIDIPYTGE